MNLKRVEVQRENGNKSPNRKWKQKSKEKRENKSPKKKGKQRSKEKMEIKVQIEIGTKKKGFLRPRCKIAVNNAPENLS